MKKILVIAGIAAIAVICLLVWRMRSDKYLVRKQFRAICEAVSKSSGEGNAAMTVKMLTLGNLLDDTVMVDLKAFPWNGVSSGEELVSLAVRGRSFVDYLQIDALEIETDFPEPGRAVARCAVRVAARSKQGYDYPAEIRSVMSELRKVDGRTWRFQSFLEDELIRR